MFKHGGRASEQIKKSALDKDIQEILFNIIEYESADDETSGYARDALTAMSSTQQLKDSLLQKACLGDFTKCAEILITNGASLEPRPELPLCIAVTKNNKRLVELLLSYDSSKASDALAHCLDEKNYEIAGVLLRFIGFEKESGDLIWGALNIQDLKPELVTNTLSYQAEVTRKITRAASTMDIDASPPMSRSISCHSNLDPLEPVRERSESTLSVDENPLFVERKIKSLSGPSLPYNKDDPRLSLKPSNDTHFIPYSPRDVNYHHYPQQPDAAPIIGKNAGNLLPPIEQCMTPRRRRKLPNSTSDGAIKDGVITTGRSRFYTSNNINDSTEAKVMKLNSPVLPRARQVVSCASPPRLQLRNSDAIKTFDISCNKLHDITALAIHPNSLVKDLLGNLQTLHLNENLLSELSEDCCAALPTLKVLNLAKNRLVEFPYAILKHQSIETIDLSRNSIVQLDKTRITDTLSLLKLDISNNKLKSFPNWIGASFPRLNKLSLRGNNIRDIPDKSYSFRSIKEINLSDNNIARISPDFFKSCLSLEKIDLSHNLLETLPNFTQSTLSRLSQVKLSHNRLEERRPFYVPRSLLTIPSLSIVDLSSNRIAQMPDPQLWSARGLRELSLADNRIRKINLTSKSKDFWPEISRLNLSGNRIESLPKEIGDLDSLVALDISHNQITEIPNEVGHLKNVFEFPLTGLPLKHDPVLLDFRPQDIINHLRGKLKHEVPYRRIKFMLVGDGGKGKSSLLRQLANMKHPSHRDNIATVGIELRDWELKPPTRFGKKSPTTFTLNTWDFAGQEAFYSTHQYFLTSRALYIAVFDASRGRSEFANLRTWLLNIQASAPGAVVILVGTHIDQIKQEVFQDYINDLNNYINDFASEPGFPKIKANKFFVNCMKETSGIEKLREEIYEIISNFKYEGQSIVNQMVPMAYVKLEDLLRNEAGAMALQNILPIKKWGQIVKLCQDNDLLINEEELKCALKFLKETGMSQIFHNFFFKLKWSVEFDLTSIFPCSRLFAGVFNHVLSQSTNACFVDLVCFGCLFLYV